MKITLLVLAAGMGSRYGGLKQIDPVGPSGEIIMDYSIFDALRAGFEKVVFVIREDINKAFRESVGARFENIVDVEYVYQELNKLPAGFTFPSGRTKPWGTGHAILMAKDVIDGAFAVINADDFYGRSGYELLAKYMSKISDGKFSEYSMTGFTLSNTLSEFGSVARGVCSCDTDGYLLDVTEHTGIERHGNGILCNENGQSFTGNEVVSMNMWGFTPSIFGHLEQQFENFLKVSLQEEKSEFFIPSAVDSLIKQSQARVKVVESGDLWFGITYRDDKQHVVKNIKELVESGTYPERLF